MRLAQQLEPRPAFVLCLSLYWPNGQFLVIVLGPYRELHEALEMQGVKRKLVFVTSFELIAVLFNTLILTALGHDTSLSSGLAVASSTVAMLWNLCWNSAFEYWEARRADRTRTLFRRALHAVGFELGLLGMLVPLFAYSLQIALLDALALNVGLVVFFLIYTFMFNLIFDKLFGLPLSARQAPQG
ncbi:PACE efflux transporter [Pseudomonas bohemica]|uniref:PACE efflux transporter n=1 Tax=Pseudomonas bohemica TaxID=2044872 RepID=UPI001F29CAB1|nr:PACE efflux transporter [Pseudomonas bohemica]